MKNWMNSLILYLSKQLSDACWSQLCEEAEWFELEKFKMEMDKEEVNEEMINQMKELVHGNVNFAVQYGLKGAFKKEVRRLEEASVEERAASSIF